MQQKYAFHFRQTDIPLLFIDLFWRPESYGAFDYRILHQDGMASGYLSPKGLKQAYQFGEQLLNNDKLAQQVISYLDQFSKSDNPTLLNDIETLKKPELIERWKIMIGQLSEMVSYYRYCEQPVLASLEKVVLDSCKNSDEAFQVLDNPKLADNFNFSLGSKKSLDLLMELGNLKYAVHKEIEPWMEAFYTLAQMIARENFISVNQALAIRASEMKKALLGDPPPVAILNERLKGCVFLPPEEGSGWTCLTGDGFKKWEKILAPASKDEIKGMPTFPGKVTGKVKIHLSAIKTVSIRKGTVLVSGMTIPQLVPMLKKAAAIITDEGGLTCHAAIISREMKIPCIVGTGIATRVLKDGDIVEVDAESGTVKIISRKTAK